MAFTQPLDLEFILVNTLAGNPEIFTFISLIVLAGVAAYFKMPNYLALVMFALFGVIMSTYLGGVYLISILLGGIMVFYSVARIVK